jgi:AraC-like DNA-binding protein
MAEAIPMASPVFQMRVPGPALSRWVSFLWYWEGAPLPHAREAVVAGAGASLMVNLAAEQLRHFDGPAFATEQRTAAIALSGPSTRAIAIDAYQPRMLGAQLKPGAALALFGHAMHAFRDVHVGLDDLIGAECDRWYAQLQRVPGARALECLHDLLLEQAGIAAPCHPVLVRALSAIEHAPYSTRVAHLARDCGISARRLTDLFTDAVGLTPKHYLRLVRFTHMIEYAGHEAQSGRAVDWSATASEFGYSDQAHLVREFRELSGVTPTAYMQRPGQGARHIRLADT